MKEKAPPDVLALAAAYTCGHCNSDPARLTQDEYGIWHLAIGHDEGCPVLTRAVSDIPDTLRAFRRTP
ncbi:hypothetical protein J3A78_002112 [Streptomyces sp. PvR006]|nr:hypothetical protein [Streptomyces sp. PvR006]